MSEKVELKKRYVKLKQEGNEKEASKVLRNIWSFKKDSEKSIKKIYYKKVPSKEKKIPKKTIVLDDLTKIKGIGKKTLKDIKSLYGNIDLLIKDLKNGKRLPLRDDIEVKLKDFLI